MTMPLQSHPSIDGSTGSAGSRESSPADSPAYIYPQEIVTNHTNTQEQVQYSPEISSSAVRQMSVLRHHDVIYSNSSHSHLPLRKRPFVNAVTHQNLDRQEIRQQPIRRRSTSPPYQRQSPTKSTSPYRITKPLSPVRVPVIVSNPYSGRLEVWRHKRYVIDNICNVTHRIIIHDVCIQPWTRYSRLGSPRTNGYPRTVHDDFSKLFSLSELSYWIPAFIQGQFLS